MTGAAEREHIRSTAALDFPTLRIPHSVKTINSILSLCVTETDPPFQLATFILRTSGVKMMPMTQIQQLNCTSPAL